MFRKIRRPSLRDQLTSSQKASDFYAAMAEKPRVESKLLAALPPKRERIRRPVDNKPVGPSEHQEQSRVISWWWLQHELYSLPVISLFAVPNGGARDPITGSRLKAEGVRAGALDLILAKPTAAYHGLFLEMKVGNKKPTDEQEKFLEYLNAAGYKATVHWSSDSAIQAIKDYLA